MKINTNSDMSSQRNIINITEKKHRYIQTSIYMIYSVMLYVTSIFKVFFNFIFFKCIE